MKNKDNGTCSHFMSTEELNDDDCVQKWQLIINATRNTAKIYTFSMQKYTDFTKMTPAELLQEATSESTLHMTERKILTRIPGFIRYLENGGCAPKTVKTMVAAISSYYTSNYVDVPKLARSVKKAKVLEKNDIMTNKEEVQKVLNIASLRDRAMILIQVSSGMSADELPKLTVDQFYKGYDPETQVATIRGRRGKTDIDYITFLNPEATRAIIEYLEWRDTVPSTNFQRDMDIYEKRKASPESPLLIKGVVSNEYLKDRDEKHRRLTSIKISNTYAVLARRAGVATSKGEMNSFRSHNMRKYFSTTLNDKGLEFIDIECMMAHEQGAVNAAYYKHKPEVLKEKYMKVMSALYIEEKFDVTATPEYQEVVREKEEVVKEKEELLTQVSDVNKAVEFVREKSKEFKNIEENLNMMIDYLGIEKYRELKSKVEIRRSEEAMREVEA